MEHFSKQGMYRKEVRSMTFFKGLYGPRYYKTEQGKKGQGRHISFHTTMHSYQVPHDNRGTFEWVNTPQGRKARIFNKLLLKKSC